METNSKLPPINQQQSNALKVGFIGGSIRSAVGYAHFVAAEMDQQFELVAGCFSKDAQTNHKSAKAYGVEHERLYADWRDMLINEHGKLDAIIVLTPTPNHFDCVSACLKAGFAVICEKSLAIDSEQTQQLLALRDKAKGFLAVTYNYTGYPMVRELAQKIKQGELGKLLHFQIEMPQEGFVRVDQHGHKPNPQHWRLSDGNIPTIYLDLAVHLHQMIHYLTGLKPLELVADQRQYGWFDGVVDNVSCLCRYTENVQGQIWFSKSSLGHRNGLKVRVYGTHGSAEWVQMNPEELIISHVNGKREILDRAASVEISNMQRYNRFKPGHPSGFIEAFANLYQDIAYNLRQFKQTGVWQSQEVFGAELALEGLFFLEAMVESAKEKRWVEVKGQQPYANNRKNKYVLNSKHGMNTDDEVYQYTLAN